MQSFHITKGGEHCYHSALECN